MIVRIKPSRLSGAIHAAASKSSMQRACAAALVRKGRSVIGNPGTSNDDKAALGIIKAMGASWSMTNNQLTIDSTNAIIHQSGNAGEKLSIHCGESGLSIRMFTPIVALSDASITIDGEGSLLKRPMDFFDEIFPQLGVDIQSKGGKIPLHIQGPVQPHELTIDGSLSSQYLTGLLMAFSIGNGGNVSKAAKGNQIENQAENQVTLHVKNLKSKPYIDLTLDVMKRFGLRVPENINYERFVFDYSKEPVTESGDLMYTVEGDWSGAAFLLVAGAIAGPITVQGLDIKSTQADKKILEALMDCGCSLSVAEEQIEIGPAALKAFQFDATDCPDLFPPLVALASYCKGITAIQGVSRLAHKESDRAITLQDEFGKMGVKIELQGDLMLVHGGEAVEGAVVHSRHDHRIAMAGAVAALKAKGEMVIEEAQAVNKSYPDFYEHIRLLGASVNELIPETQNHANH